MLPLGPNNFLRAGWERRRLAVVVSAKGFASRMPTAGRRRSHRRDKMQRGVAVAVTPRRIINQSLSQSFTHESIFQLLYVIKTTAMSIWFTMSVKKFWERRRPAVVAPSKCFATRVPTARHFRLVHSGGNVLGATASRRRRVIRGLRVAVPTAGRRRSQRHIRFEARGRQF